MRISVFGLGYVGCVSAACLARDGHEVVGVDTNDEKVALLNQARSPIIEPGVDAIISEAVASGRLRATNSASEAVSWAELTLICVGTPSQRNGSLDVEFVRKVCREIGAALRETEGFHVVALRSTVLPGTMRDVVIPTLEEASSLTAGRGFGVCNNPEFLREGSAVEDYDNPPKTVIGETDKASGDLLAGIYAHLDAPMIRTSVEVAEMAKYTDNSFHALKVTFANEIGNICKEMGIDSHEVMDIFSTDTKLNLSSYYLRPGFAFGGSCLPKDVRALTYKARSLDLDTPLLSSIMQSNDRQLARGIEMITATGHKRIGILGFAFKAGTDDLRESPMVDVIETLIGKGYELALYDRNVSLAALTGANRNYILNHIPHISNLMRDSVAEVVDFADVIVLGNRSSEFAGVAGSTPEGKVVVDLVRVTDRGTDPGIYEGICW